MKPTQIITERTIHQMIADFLYRDPADISPDDDCDADLCLASLDRLDLLTQIESRHQLPIDDSHLTEIAISSQLMSALRQARIQ